jgi:mono/diheme cytochrome c family protein
MFAKSRQFMVRLTTWRLTMPWLICWLCPLILSQEPSSKVSFIREIEPVLQQRCQKCHGPDKQQGGLRLDQRPSLLLGGDSGLPAVIPGEPASSPLNLRIHSLEVEERMPPEGEPLTRKEKELLDLWVLQGAIWPSQGSGSDPLQTRHWAFQPITAEVLLAGDSHPIDHFIDRALSQKGISPNPQAAPSQLLRRLSILLTGLPPSVEELEAFEASYQKNAKKTVAAWVDRKLASPHFGERWAQHWLDVIRWAETNGSEANLFRKGAWLYRDYVIEAFNQDKPYDQFVTEQIAGDVMGAGAATGFLVAGPHVPAATVGREPSAVRQARADRMDEIMQTIGASMLGITMQCARCHTHKFDPITLKDYYAMSAVFEDIEFGSRHLEWPDHDPRQQNVVRLQQSLETTRNELRNLGAWEEDWTAYRAWHFTPIQTQAIRLRFLKPNVTVDELEILGPAQPGMNLALKRHGTQVAGFPSQGVDNRNPVEVIQDGMFGTMAWRTKKQEDLEELPWLECHFEESQWVHQINLSANREAFQDTDYLEQSPHLPTYAFAVDAQQPDGAWKEVWNTKTLLSHGTPPTEEVQAKVRDLQTIIQTLKAEGPPMAFVGRLREPSPTRVLYRGSPESPRDVVAPAAPAILNGSLGLTQEASGPDRRLRFARWMTHPDHPLLARVMVNRLWHHLFGAGLVPTTSDFGQAGSLPSHPALLDWLAHHFIHPVDGSDAWSIKALIRLIATSDAFSRSSAPSPEAMEMDADNRWLWRFAPRRLEAEVIRDSILMAADRLDTRLGGPGYRIHNIKKTYAQWEVTDNHGTHTWRRMIYQERMRRVDDQLFTAFDFPDCGQIRSKRPISTTPLQALNLMNSPFVVEQAKAIADQALEETGGENQAAVIRCFERLVARMPEAEELRLGMQLASKQSLHLLCRSLINANEFAFLR